jgi:hypothetical protein
MDHINEQCTCKKEIWTNLLPLSTFCMYAYCDPAARNSHISLLIFASSSLPAASSSWAHLGLAHAPDPKPFPNHNEVVLFVAALDQS